MALIIIGQDKGIFGLYTVSRLSVCLCPAELRELEEDEEEEANRVP